MRISSPLLVSMMLLSSCATRYDTDLERKIKEYSGRPPMQSNRLQINSANNFTFYSKKSESKGVEDLFRLITRANSEESYLYENGTWIETGYLETTFYVNGGLHETVEIDKKIVAGFARNNSKLTLWHIHRAEEDLTNNITKAYIVLPSSQDLISLMYFYRFCKNENPLVEIDQGIVSRYGKTRYGLSRHGKEVINGLISSRSDSDSQMLDRIIGSARDDSVSDIKSCLNELSSTNPDLDKPSRLKAYFDLIEITFSPMKAER